MARKASFGCLAGVLMAAMAAGQHLEFASGPASARPSSPDFGTQNLSFMHVGAVEFTPMNSVAQWNGDLTPTIVTRFTYNIFSPFEAALHVPGGSLINYVEFDYCDSNASAHMTLDLLECDYFGHNCTSILPLPLDSSNVGCGFHTVSGLNHVIDNYNKLYVLKTMFGAPDGTNSLVGVIVGYKLQVSPDPAFATFNDVPVGHPQHQFIEALAASGITAGCGGGNYCPTSPLTRGQMAVFLAKALGLTFP